jgi:LytS/YehU family sensor histidine kinase
VAERRSRRRPVEAEGARWSVVLLVWLTLVVSLASLSSLFLGAGWWVAGAAVSAVVLGAAGLVRSLGGSPWLGWLVGLLAGTATATALVSGRRPAPPCWASSRRRRRSSGCATSATRRP